MCLGTEVLSTLLRVGDVEYYVHDTAIQRLSPPFPSAARWQEDLVPCTVVSWVEKHFDDEDLNDDFAFYDDV